MKIRFLAFACILALVLPAAQAQSDNNSTKTYNSQKEKFSYAIGFQVGHGLRRNEDILDLDVVLQAVSDAYKGSEPAVPIKDMQAAVEAYRAKQEKEAKAQQAKLTAEAKKNKEAGTKYLAENKTKDGVKTTASGLQYKVLTEGKGKKPTLDNTVVVNYRGKLLDGSEFDSSYKRNQPATLALNSVIKGWQEALQLMPAGSKWELVIPSELAYGDRGAGSRIGPGETLLFEVELLEVK
jgi:FKBP-type peptidyl-prolyl cis-trans isomerase